MDFMGQERIHFKFQLQQFIVVASLDLILEDLSIVAELCQTLVRTEKSKIYFLLERLIRLLLTLPVSTAS